MSGFIASPVAPASPQSSSIAAGAFWPDIDINAFRDAMRIGDQAIPHARVEEALLGGIVQADDNLVTWRAQREAEGAAKLADVEAPQIGGVSRLALLWRRAVYGFAAADLIETHRDVSATAAGAARAEQQATTPDDHRRNAIHAIRAMKGERRTSVALI